MRFFILLALVLGASCSSYLVQAQCVMFIPFVEEEGRRRLITDDDACSRIIESKLKEVVDDRTDFAICDYRAAMTRLQAEDIYCETIANCGLIDDLVRSDDPEYYVTMDVTREQGQSSEGKQQYKLIINLNAYRTADDHYLASTVCHSGWFYSDNCLGLTTQAFYSKDPVSGERNINNLIDKLQERIANTAQAIAIEFKTRIGAEANFMTRLTGREPIVQAVKHWIDENALSQDDNPEVSPNRLFFPGLTFERDPLATTLELDTYLRELKLLEEATQELTFTFDVSGQTVTFWLQ